MTRLQQTRAAIEIQRMLSPKILRRRIPKQVYPKNLERDYTRALLGQVNLVEIALAPLIAQLPVLFRQRNDAGESRRAEDLISQAREETENNNEELLALLLLLGFRIGNHSTAQLAKQIRAVLGVDLHLQSHTLNTAAEGFASENAALVRDIPVKIITNVEGEVMRGINAGASQAEVKAAIAKELRKGKQRAKLIGRDQTGKMVGKAQEVQQKALGIERFIWRNVGDRRVRPLHVEIDGNEYTWSEGHPSEGLPGEPIMCRCFPEPVLTDLL